MIAEGGLILLAFFAGIYWHRGRNCGKSIGENCYVCGKPIGTESNVTDHKRHIFYHFKCWTGIVRHDVFGQPSDLPSV